MTTGAGSANPPQDQVDTVMAAWSWGGEPEAGRRSHGGSGNDAPTPFNTRAVTSERGSGEETSTSNTPEASPDSSELQASANSASESPPLKDLGSLRRRRSSAPFNMVGAPAVGPTRPPLTPSLDRRTRRELLGNRKASNYPTEDAHFRDHRDSVQVYHRRMLRNSISEHKQEEAAPSHTLEHQLAGAAADAATYRGRRASSSGHADGMKRAAVVPMPSCPSRPINCVAKLVRSPDRGIEREGSSTHWLDLVGERHRPSQGVGGERAVPPPISGKIPGGFLVLTHEPRP